MPIRNLGKLIAAQQNQLNLQPKKKDKEEDLKEILQLLFTYIKENNKQTIDLLRAIQDNQKMLKVQLDKIEGDINKE